MTDNVRAKEAELIIQDAILNALLKVFGDIPLRRAMRIMANPTGRQRKAILQALEESDL